MNKNRDKKIKKNNTSQGGDSITKDNCNVLINYIFSPVTLRNKIA